MKINYVSWLFLMLVAVLLGLLSKEINSPFISVFLCIILPAILGWHWQRYWPIFKNKDED
jgi:hypothetical protein